MVKLPLLLDKGIMCSAMFRSVLFLEAFTHCPSSVAVNTDLECVSMCLPHMSQGCVYCMYRSSSSDVSSLVP